ncbi:MAG: hypothetical protein NZ518_00120 [Dehalococcoidia bacterium]|nr:hypothetical protein [Dehalococcoidia bacterium]
MTDEPRLLPEHEAEHFRLIPSGDYVMLWHGNTQIALLRRAPDTEARARAIVEQRRAELRAIAERTGWKPTLPPTG